MCNIFCFSTTCLCPANFTSLHKTRSLVARADMNGTRSFKSRELVRDIHTNTAKNQKSGNNIQKDHTQLENILTAKK